MPVSRDVTSGSAPSWQRGSWPRHLPAVRRLLIILALIVRKISKFDAGKEAIQAVGKIVAYAMFANVFFLGLEFFTAFYSGIPGPCAFLRVSVYGA